MSGSINNSYSSSIRNPIKTIYIGGSSTSGGGGGGTNYWTLSGNNIYNNNTGSVGINTSTPDLSYNLDVSGSVRIRGDLLIDGSSTIIDTNILKVEDPLIHLGINNPADLKAGGFYVEYRDASNNKDYTGMVRPPKGTGYVLLNNSSVEPSDSYPDISTLPTSGLSVERLGVNKPLSSLSSLYVDISGLTRIWTSRVLIGSNAGNTGQDSNAIAIGNNAGNSNQGLNSIAIGSNAAYYLQNPNAIAVGRSAGAIAQGYNTVAMGYMAGEASQNTGALSLGFQAGRTFQGTNSIAIGVNAGEINQGCNSIAIGNQAGQNNQCNNTIVLNASGTSLNPTNINGFYVDPIRNVINDKAVYYNTTTKEITYSDISSGGSSLPQGNVYGEYLLYNGVNWFVDGSKNVAIGYNSGRFNQDISAVAIGFESGYTGQGSNAVAIGNQAGNSLQGSNSIAIGLQAGKNTQGASSIAIGEGAGFNLQGVNSIAIGRTAGNVYQRSSAIAIGFEAGQSGQKYSAVSIGRDAGFCNQGEYAVAIGYNAGLTQQQDNAISIGSNAGSSLQSGNAIAIGGAAGQNTQQNYAIALGYYSGNKRQGGNSVAIGIFSGSEYQQDDSVAIGNLAGYYTQGVNSIAVGPLAGSNSQGSQSISIGSHAGSINQKNYSIAIGNTTGNINQDNYAIAMGEAAGQVNQGASSIAIGSNAGQIDQSGEAVAIGTNAGYRNQGSQSVAIGIQTGVEGQRQNAVAIGSFTGTTNQGTNAIAIGYLTGRGTQGSNAIAIGQYAGDISQNSSSVAIGEEAGYIFQGTTSIAIGKYAGRDTQKENSVAIGNQAGYCNQGTSAISIGYLSGYQNQSSNSIAIGLNAGKFNQKTAAVAIGHTAGQTNQGGLCVAIGNTAGQSNQIDGSVAIGHEAGKWDQKANCVAVGRGAGSNLQGANAIAIGYLSGFNAQGERSIVINATGSVLNNTIPDSCVIAPIRNASQTNYIGYNTGTKELTYFDTISNVNITDISAIGTTIYYPTFVDGSGNKPLYIDSTNTLSYRNQNFGIGTTTPQAKLDVATGNDGVSAIFSSANGVNNFNSVQLRGGTAGSSVNWQISKDNKLANSLQIAPSTTNAGTTFATPIFTIENNGNVGIGTITPQTTLDVSGNLMVSSNLIVDTNTLFVDASNNRVGVGTTTPQAKLDVATGNGVSAIFSNANGANNFNSVQLRGGTAGSSVNWQISKDNKLANSLQIAPSTTNAGTTFATPIFTIENNGNVGIGTITPQTTLDVSGNLMVSSNLIVDTNTLFVDASNNRVGVGTTTPACKLSILGSTNLVSPDNDLLKLQSATGSGASDVGISMWAMASGADVSARNWKLATNFQGHGLFQILRSTSNTGVPNINAMTIDKDGNTGIGTTTPSATLDVRQNASGYVGVFYNTSATGEGVAIRGGNTSSQNSLVVQNYDGNNQILIARSDGNVGIGTSTPAYPLDVSGSAKFTTIRDNNNLVGTDGQILSSTSTGLSWITPSVPSVSTGYAVLRETKPAGVNAAYNFSGTTLIRRRLNNVVNSNGITITFMPDVSGNFIIAEAGTYSFRGRACYSTNDPPYGQGVFPARLYISNETLGLENAITGETSLERLLYTVADGNINSKNYWLDIDGILTIAANTVISMKMFSFSTSGTSNNGGRAINIGGVEELYSTLTIQKLA